MNLSRNIIQSLSELFYPLISRLIFFCKNYFNSMVGLFFLKPFYEMRVKNNNNPVPVYD